MDQPEIESAILNKLYGVQFEGCEETSLRTVCSEGGCDQKFFWNVVETLSSKDLIEAWASGGMYRLTPRGVLAVEERQLGSADVILENQGARSDFIVELAKHREIKGAMSTLDYRSVCSRSGIDKATVEKNLLLLCDLGYIESGALGTFKITQLGLSAVADWQSQNQIADEFKRISGMEPRSRGRALNKLLAQAIQEDGWISEDGVKTKHEEMDVVVHKHREYYVIECKWQKDPIEAGVIRELHGKLSNRAGVNGILASMSGFTKGAVDQVLAFAAGKPILLFGAKDIHAITHSEASFEQLLGDKYDCLVSQRSAQFE